MFIRKKRIKNREYYYAVFTSPRFERYIGINPPTHKEIELLKSEIDSTKRFIESNKDKLTKLKNSYRNFMQKATKDQILKMEQELVTRLTYDSSRIEGSSLSYKDTKMLLQEGITPANKPIRDVRETENLWNAYKYMKDKKEISIQLILTLHKILKKDITEDAGEFRDGQVYVSDLIPINAKLVETEINNSIGWLIASKSHPLEKASIFHAMFERIHPFFDGNGRIGRLLLNFILVKSNFPLVIIQNKNKRRYYNALKKADCGNYLFMIKFIFSELMQTNTFLQKY